MSDSSFPLINQKTRTALTLPGIMDPVGNSDMPQGTPLLLRIAYKTRMNLVINTKPSAPGTYFISVVEPYSDK